MAKYLAIRSLLSSVVKFNSGTEVDAIQLDSRPNLFG